MENKQCYQDMVSNYTHFNKRAHTIYYIQSNKLYKINIK